MQKPEYISINDHISYLTATEEPLSANVVLIEGDTFLWVYDVGNHPVVPGWDSAPAFISNSVKPRQRIACAGSG